MADYTSVDFQKVKGGKGVVKKTNFANRDSCFAEQWDACSKQNGSVEHTDVKATNIYAENVFASDEIELSDEGGSVGVNLSNKIHESLIGNFVRIMAAPRSTTLTDDEVLQIVDGRYINGEFLGLKNPVFFPAYKETNGTYHGIVIGAHEGYYINYVAQYFISNNVIDRTTIIEINPNSSIKIANVSNLNNNPASGTHTLKSVDGVLTWVAE